MNAYSLWFAIAIGAAVLFVICIALLRLRVYYRRWIRTGEVIGSHCVPGYEVESPATYGTGGLAAMVGIPPARIRDFTETERFLKIRNGRWVREIKVSYGEYQKHPAGSWYSPW